jgi:hemoglobin
VSPEPVHEGADAPDDTVRQVTVHEYVGGDAFFAELVERFYAGIETDPLLRPMYPEDLTDSKAFLAGFLVQFWGGSGAYSEQRGHPRLRMRHFPFTIGDAEAAAWFRHMSAAVDAMHLDDVVRPVLLEYFERAANAMINVEPPSPA